MSDAIEKLKQELEDTRHALAEAGARYERRDAECKAASGEFETLFKKVEHAHQEWISALDVVEDPIFLHDGDFRILRCNRAYQQCAGIPFEEIIGKPYYEVFPITPGPLKHCLRTMENNAEAGDEEIVTVGDTFYRSRGFPVKDRDGNFLCSMHTLEDFTESLQAEERYRTIFNRSPDIMCLVDPKTNTIVLVNDSVTHFTGFRQEEVIGMEISNLISIEETDDRFLFSKNGLQGRKIRMADGNFRRMDLTISTIPWENTEHLFITLRDVQEKYELEKERMEMVLQIQHKSRMESIGRLTAGVAHEINSPAQYIGSNIQFVIESTRSNMKTIEQIRDAIAGYQEKGFLTAAQLAEVNGIWESRKLDSSLSENIKALSESMEGLQKLIQIVTAMKEISHPDSIAMEEMNISRAIESILSITRNEWKYSSTVEVNLDPSIVHLTCYPGDFSQILLNLIINASDAIKEKFVTDAFASEIQGVIRIESRAAEDGVEFSVADNGSGIPEKIKNRIFEPFFTTKPTGKGTGQGLAIVETLVRKNNGHIDVRDREGGGTVISFYLPNQAGEDWWSEKMP